VGKDRKPSTSGPCGERCEPKGPHKGLSSPGRWEWAEKDKQWQEKRLKQRCQLPNGHELVKAVEEKVLEKEPG